MGISPQQYRDLCGRMKLDPITGGLPKAHKYNARKKEVDGIVFDSTAEARRYVELKALWKSGDIARLSIQPRFVLQKAFRDTSGKHHRQMEFVGDFRYVDGCGNDVVEDVKGVQTAAFRLKWKLVIARYPHILFRLTGGRS